MSKFNAVNVTLDSAKSVDLVIQGFGEMREEQAIVCFSLKMSGHSILI